MADILNQHPISIEIDGRTISGTYSTWAGIITVRALGRVKNAQIGSLRPKFLARIMLREMVGHANRASNDP
jgi:hypothetical protein